MGIIRRKLHSLIMYFLSSVFFLKVFASGLSFTKTGFKLIRDHSDQNQSHVAVF